MKTIIHFVLRDYIKTFLVLVALFATLLALSSCSSVREPSDEEMYRFAADREYYLEQHKNVSFEDKAALEAKRLRIQRERLARDMAEQDLMIQNYQARVNFLGQEAQAYNAIGNSFMEMAKPNAPTTSFDTFKDWGK